MSLFEEAKKVIEELEEMYGCCPMCLEISYESYEEDNFGDKEDERTPFVGVFYYYGKKCACGHTKTRLGDWLEIEREDIEKIEELADDFGMDFEHNQI